MDSSTKESVSEHGAGVSGGLGDVPAPPPTSGKVAVEAAAAAEDKVQVEGRHRVSVPDIDDATAEDATVWLLQSFRDEVERPTHTLELNVGSISKPRKIKWRIQALAVETIDRIREDAMPATNRAMRRGGVAALGDPRAQYRANLKLIVAATLDPDLKGVSGTTGFAAGNPEEFLVEAFRYNSGLVDIIASAILTLSGYDEDNVQDSVEAKATGN